MTKQLREIDSRNPFIPSRDRLCSAFDTAMIFAVALAGIAAGLATIARQLGVL